MREDIDIIRDLKSHCVAFSAADKKKERIGIAFMKRTMSIANMVAFAAEFNSERFAIVWDNQSTEDNIAPLVAAEIGSLPSRSDSPIGKTIDVAGFETKEVLSEQAIEFLTGQGVLVCAKDTSGVFTIRDDVTTAGSAYDIVGTLTDDNLRKGLRSNFGSFVGRVKITDSTIQALREETIRYLAIKRADGIINDFDEASISVERSTSDLFKAIITFTYTRVRTLKRIEFNYYVV